MEYLVQPLGAVGLRNADAVLFLIAVIVIEKLPAEQRVDLLRRHCRDLLRGQDLLEYGVQRHTAPLAEIPEGNAGEL